MISQNKLERKGRALLGSFITTAMLLCGPAQSSVQEKELDQDLQRLVSSLRSIDYDVRFENTPVPGKYGLTDAKNKKIWVTNNNRNGYIQKNTDS